MVRFATTATTLFRHLKKTGRSATLEPTNIPLSDIADPFGVLHTEHNGFRFLTPRDLQSRRSKIRILLVGSCLLEGVSGVFESECRFVGTNNLAELGQEPPNGIASYDVQVVQIALNSIMPCLSWARAPMAPPEHYELLFSECVDRLKLHIWEILKWNRLYSIPTLVMNFITPLQNPLGEWLPRNELQNIVFAIESLNSILSQEIAKLPNAFYLDINNIANTIGKKHISDSIICHDTHGAIIVDTGYDEMDFQRIEPILPVTRHYDAKLIEFLQAIHEKIVSFNRSLMQEESVKLVIVDLDNTLWKGTAAEDGQAGEGVWALGFWETLLWLKKRGILLGIASKNTHDYIAANWDRLVNPMLKLDDFAAVRINWDAKADNVGEIMDECKLLPQNTVFIDDNPVERAAVADAFPGIRVLGTYPFYFKRILLWSAETQQVAITEESANRTRSIQNSIKRDKELKPRLSREKYIDQLEIVLAVAQCSGQEDQNFRRVFELTNKTNQFNTTGRRWTVADFVNLFHSGGKVYYFTVKDRLVNYGLVGCVFIRENTIEQFVMSCRVIGLDVERTVLRWLLDNCDWNSAGPIKGRLLNTELNMPCRSIFKDAGWLQDGDVFIKTR